MVRMAQQQRTVIGTLKALGYSNYTLLFHYLKFAAAAGMAGGIIGGFLGYWLGDATTRMYTVYFSFPLLKNTVYTDILVGGLCLSLFCDSRDRSWCADNHENGSVRGHA